ncbi:MAG: SDR family oxidoreductase [Nanoarchaeota archaeon]|nr:SDR family oxidoreductase [Nanoarchaeota archaeon]
MCLEKTILITGASSGIGKSVTKQLAEQGHKVIMLCRNKEKSEKVIKEIDSKNAELLLCDLADFDDVKRAAKEFKNKYSKLDVLVNNAGSVFADRRTNKQGYELTFSVNHLGHFLLTNELLDIITERVINVSSYAHKFGKINFEDINLENSYNSLKAYSQSKLVNILFTYELARRNKKITVNCLDPGFVKTNVGENDKNSYVSYIMKIIRLFSKSPEKGAETIVYLATSKDVENITGKYFCNKKIKKSSKKSYDLKVAKKLWDLSEEMVTSSPD